MSFHVDFLEYLKGLPSGASLVAAYNIYKQADAMFAYLFNGCLKSCHAPPDEIVTHFQHLKRIICARNIAPLTVYRMTSDTEFVGPLLPVIRGAPFRYPAFLSTSRQVNNLGTFVPNSGNRLLLEIHCPVGTAMVILEADGGLEDEYLFGAGTLFHVDAASEIDDPQEILSLICYYMIAHRARMKDKWAFGQFAPMFTGAEFTLLLAKIQEKAWPLNEPLVADTSPSPLSAG